MSRIEAIPTSLIPSASELLLMYSGRSPPDIHLEMSWKGVGVTPSRDTIFGCVRCFHIMASWQKIWVSLVMANRESDSIKNVPWHPFVDHL